jgi:hypothetical protein
MKIVLAVASIAVAMLLGTGSAHATPSDGCYGNNYFDRSRWACEPIAPPPPPPPLPQNLPPCDNVDIRFCPGLWN